MKSFARIEALARRIMAETKAYAGAA